MELIRIQNVRNIIGRVETLLQYLPEERILELHVREIFQMLNNISTNTLAFEEMDRIASECYLLLDTIISRFPNVVEVWNQMN